MKNIEKAKKEKKKALEENAYQMANTVIDAACDIIKVYAKYKTKRTIKKHLLKIYTIRNIKIEQLKAQRELIILQPIEPENLNGGIVYPFTAINETAIIPNNIFKKLNEDKEINLYIDGKIIAKDIKSLDTI